MKSWYLLHGFLRRGLVVVGTLLLSSPSFAQTQVGRSGWVPTVGSFTFGDMWFFNCPANGTVTVGINSYDDTGDGNSNLDPVIEVRDKDGNLLVDQFGDPFAGLADDTFECFFPSICGTGCPAIFDVPCGKGNPHSIAVYSLASSVSEGCVGGGGYFLFLSAQDKKGKDVPEKKLGLGGGANSKLPKWVEDQDGIDKAGPALDDELIPAFYSANPTSAVAVPVGTVQTKEQFRMMKDGNK
ncbi:MAG TPA: hypothetical protein VH681_12070 [Nitrospiraceae bacterium]